MDEHQDLFVLRMACDSDLPLINLYASCEGMGAIESAEHVVVAVNSEDEAVGFVRLVIIDDDVAYVNPLVTLSTWRGYGVGRLLMKWVQSRYSDVRLVARGKSVGFYERVGFTNISWKEIDRRISEECTGCELRTECCPQPMAYMRK